MYCTVLETLAPLFASIPYEKALSRYTVRFIWSLPILLQSLLLSLRALSDPKSVSCCSKKIIVRSCTKRTPAFSVLANRLVPFYKSTQTFIRDSSKRHLTLYSLEKQWPSKISANIALISLTTSPTLYSTLLLYVGCSRAPVKPNTALLYFLGIYSAEQTFPASHYDWRAPL